ncbi:MAG: conjugative transfer system coupling protein TraD [Gammaproteobacteria bacterium]|nr:conjugative transfer system coupling protein TraD [Rhodocyclaceae bacterium]MBU3910870.1 conjugative transfer system coupling protein TraD [Gammaproteobacteria bacterium]MBU4006324.1 conjugative transfer system coupling protein TraD [Gammaproteobacteria bacterium]MBU4097931.1 conjugative transfer system coupling protein TraD [Gammaproteobacteria bacterium]MBU4148637.1 conjugative transfer system coupling protein TraD [Gammaproteobacteria bacterium]
MAATWMGASALTLAVTKTLPVPTRFGVLTSLLCTGFAAYRSIQAWRRSQDKTRIRLTEKQFIEVPELLKIARRASLQDAVWLGSGFHWTDIEAGRMHALIGRGVAAQMGKEILHKDGAYWLHGLAKEEDAYADLSNLVGHTLIVGTTRVGKTRLFDLLIAQAICRGEPVIIIDPKGDHGLAHNARKVCEALGQSDRFIYFHPAHPEKSACIDPLRNWNRKTELASRIAALIPSETGADPFTAFGWKVLNDIVNGLIATGVRPNMVQLRRYIEGGPEDLLLKALRLHFKHKVQDWESRVSSFVKQYKGNQLLAYITFYKEIVIHDAQNVDLDGLISTYEHNRDHFQKMVASLIPILSMLTSDPLTDLLSPDFGAGHERVVTDMARAIRADKVLYVGLDSLADATVGSAIGSVLLADLAAVAGDRYNYGIDTIKPVNLFIDEAAEVINQPTIQLMNKGGGALFRVTIATQTFADFASRLGDENKARQVLANTNNKIALRILDAETQQYIADGIPKIKARTLMIRYGHNVDSNIHDAYSASYQEQAAEEEADLIPPAILSELPPLHFFARLSGGKTIKGRLPILKW